VSQQPVKRGPKIIIIVAVSLALLFLAWFIYSLPTILKWFMEMIAVIRNFGLLNISAPVWVVLVVIVLVVPVVVCVISPFKFICNREPRKKKGAPTKRMREKDGADDSKHSQ